MVDQGHAVTEIAPYRSAVHAHLACDARKGVAGGTPGANLIPARAASCSSKGQVLLCLALAKARPTVTGHVRAVMSARAARTPA